MDLKYGWCVESEKEERNVLAYWIFNYYEKHHFQIDFEPSRWNTWIDKHGTQQAKEALVEMKKWADAAGVVRSFTSLFRNPLHPRSSINDFISCMVVDEAASVDEWAKYLLPIMLMDRKKSLSQYVLDKSKTPDTEIHNEKRWLSHLRSSGERGINVDVSLLYCVFLLLGFKPPRGFHDVRWAYDSAFVRRKDSDTEAAIPCDGLSLLFNKHVRARTMILDLLDSRVYSAYGMGMLSTSDHELYPFSSLFKVPMDNPVTRDEKSYYTMFTDLDRRWGKACSYLDFPRFFTWCYANGVPDVIEYNSHSIDMFFKAHRGDHTVDEFVIEIINNFSIPTHPERSHVLLKNLSDLVGQEYATTHSSVEKQSRQNALNRVIDNHLRKIRVTSPAQQKCMNVIRSILTTMYIGQYTNAELNALDAAFANMDVKEPVSSLPVAPSVVPPVDDIPLSSLPVASDVSIPEADVSDSKDIQIEDNPIDSDNSDARVVLDAGNNGLSLPIGNENSNPDPVNVQSSDIDAFRDQESGTGPGLNDRPVDDISNTKEDAEADGGDRDSNSSFSSGVIIGGSDMKIEEKDEIPSGKREMIGSDIQIEEPIDTSSGKQEMMDAEQKRYMMEQKTDHVDHSDVAPQKTIPESDPNLINPFVGFMSPLSMTLARIATLKTSHYSLRVNATS